MKKFLMFLGAFVCLLACLFGFLYLKSGAARELGTSFVGHLSKNELGPAYSMLHKNLKRTLSYEQFTRLVADGHLDKLTMVHWTGFEMKNGITTLKGDAATSSGGDGSARIKVTSLENDGVPAILGFKFGQADDD